MPSLIVSTDPDNPYSTLIIVQGVVLTGWKKGTHADLRKPIVRQGETVDIRDADSDSVIIKII